MRRRALLGLALCAVVLAAAYPTLLGLAAFPERVFLGRDAVSITSSAAALNGSFAGTLADQPWARDVSPEAYAFSAWSGVPVVVRGVSVEAFLLLEGGSIEGAPAFPFVLVGASFAERHGLRIGDPGVLTGSTNPAIEPVVVTGILRTSGPATDEILVPLPLARKFAGLRADELGAVRLRVTDRAALLAHLEGTGLALTVTSPEGTVSVNRAGDGARIASILFLYPELRAELGRGYLSAFATQAVNGVRVVVLGLLALATLLVAAGVYAIVWRATAEASRAIGVVRALGGGRRTVLAGLLREVLPLGTPAVLGGVLAGYAVAALAGAFGTLLLFAHAVRPEVDPVAAALTVAVAFGLVALACVLAGLAAMRKPPRDLLAGVEPRAHDLPEEVLPL